MIDNDDIVGKPLHYPQYVEIEYNNRMMTLIQRMQADVGHELVKLAKSPESKQYAEQSVMDGVAMDVGSYASLQRKVMNALISKWGKAFSKVARPWSDILIKQANKASTQSVKNSTEDFPINSMIAATAIPASLKQSIQASISENVDLIKSLPTKYLTELKGDLDRVITGSGSSMAYIQEQIARNMIKRNGQIERRAQLIASDQVSKIYADMNDTRLQNAGVTEFIWRHNGSSKEPRPLHKNVLNGKVFSYKNPPIIDDRTGVRGLPGQLINCKCSARPVYKAKQSS